jgi:hypothetical protein
MPLSQFIRETLSDKAKDLLDCSHPFEMIRIFPWAQLCTKCGKRLTKEEEHQLRDLTKPLQM